MLSINILKLVNFGSFDLITSPKKIKVRSHIFYADDVFNFAKVRPLI